MKPTVFFRDFEERDVDFVFKCKNDEKLNSMIVGEARHFTHEDAQRWVQGCMGEHDTYKFWAICSNDEEKRIVGWVSLAKIDRNNQSANFHGIVIADPQYRNGFAWIETYLFILKYAFEDLGLNRLYGSSIIGNIPSNVASELFFFQLEGILRESVNKNGVFYNVRISSILKREYFKHKEDGDYEFKSILKRIKHIRTIK